MDRETIAAQLMLISAMKDRLKAAEAELRTQMGGMLKVGAVEPVTLPSDDGETVGKVRMDAGATAVVLNWPRLTDWCRAHYPATVRQEYVIIPAYRDRLQRAATSSGAGVNPETGEVLPDDCWSASRGDPKIVVAPTRNRPDLSTRYLSEALEMAGQLLDAKRKEVQP